MNNFCARYLKSNPLKAISDILRNYKKSCENFFKREKIKRNQSEPLVLQSKGSNQDRCRCKPKSEVDLPSSGRNQLSSGTITNWNNLNYNDNSSQESLKITWSNAECARSSSNLSLSKKPSHVDLNMRDKLDRMPLPKSRQDEEEEARIGVKRVYPWQNFNLAEERRPKYERVRSVASLTDEMFSRKSILRRPEPKTSSVFKEVKFNRMASMMVYPKNSYGVTRQSRINLSTDVGGGDKAATGKKRKARECTRWEYAVGRPLMCRRNLRHRTRCPLEQEGFWCLGKKQKVY